MDDRVPLFFVSQRPVLDEGLAGLLDTEGAMDLGVVEVFYLVIGIFL